MTQDDVNKAMDSICAPYPQRTIRTFGAALKSSGDPRRQTQAVLDVIDKLGLEPYIPPRPLPEITIDDIHLVCWMALTS